VRAVAGLGPRFSIGSYEAGVRAGLRTLVASNQAVAGLDRWTTFREGFGAAGYIVPAGRLFLATRLTLWANTAATFFRIGYGTTDVGSDAAAAPAGVLYLDAGLSTPRVPWVATLANVTYEWDVYIPIPAAQYPVILVAGAGVLIVAQLRGVDVAA